MPRYTPAQVARRRRIALAGLVVMGVVMLGAVASLIRALIVPDVRVADDSAMGVDPTPADAAAHTQLPGGVTLAEDEVMGIDVSSHQRAVDWEQVAADGYSFAYIKATEGAGYTDPQFEDNWAGAEDAGITRGAYHYFTLCSPGAAQAQDFLDAAPPDDSALPPVLDLEFDGDCDARPEAEHTQQEIDDFTDRVEAAWGRHVVIYSSSEWREHYGLPVADGRPQWLFSETERPDPQDWPVWQFRFDGSVAGIGHDTDIDVARIEVLREQAAMSEDQREELEARIGAGDAHDGDGDTAIYPAAMRLAAESGPSVTS